MKEKRTACKRCALFSFCASHNSAGEKDLPPPRGILKYIFLLFFLPAFILVAGLIVFYDRGPVVSFFLTLSFLALYYIVLRFRLIDEGYA